MAKLVIFTKGPNDGLAIKNALTANGVPFTEVRVDLLAYRDLPDPSDITSNTQAYTTNEMKAMIRDIWMKVRAL